MEKQKHILLVDDNQAIAETIEAYLLKEAYQVSLACDGEKAMELFRSQKIDLIILDWMMPMMSGPDVVREIRKDSQVPILMMSARDDESDVIIGLELGADDYLRKPFGPREVVARVKALLRRIGGDLSITDDLEFADIKISFAKHEVLKANEEISITPIEFHILITLVQYKNMAVSRQKLMEEALGYENAFYDRTLDTHIKNLRKKLEDEPSKPKFIQTVRGVGFKLVVNSNISNLKLN